MRVGAEVIGAEQLRAELLRIGSLPSKALAAAALDVEDLAEREAAKHNRRGALVRSLTRRRDGDAWVVGHDSQHAPHAIFVHWGTRPHKIAPRRKKALRWVGGGRFAFAKAVQHPGYRGDPYFVRAAREAPAQFEQHLARMLARGH